METGLLRLVEGHSANCQTANAVFSGLNFQLVFQEWNEMNVLETGENSTEF
jgi:hypothetical protein